VFLFAQPLFAFDNASQDSNASFVSCDNNSCYSDNITSGSSTTEGYSVGYYPVGVSRNLDVSKEINNQLKGTGLIFLPNSTGNAVPVENEPQQEQESEQDGVSDSYTIYNNDEGGK
jgi:hypothetical protein